MSSRGVSESLLELRNKLSQARNPKDIADLVARFAGEAFAADGVLISLSLPDTAAELEQDAMLRALWGAEQLAMDSSKSSLVLDQQNILFEGRVCDLPLVVNDTERATANSRIAENLSSKGIKSYALVAIYMRKSVVGWLQVQFSSNFHRWRKEDLLFLQRLAEYCGLYLEQLLPEKAVEAKAADGYSDIKLAGSESLIEHGDLIFLRADPDFGIISIKGDTTRLLGIQPNSLLHDKNVWARFVHLEDLLTLARLVRAEDKAPQAFSQELRIVHQITGEQRAFSVKAVPVASKEGGFVGWEAFGFDITNKVGTEKELASQSKRVEALYEVSRSLEFNIDPAIVALRGLRALIRATNSDAGFGCFYDRDTGRLELVASEGLSPEYISEAPEVLNGKSLLRHTVEQKRGLMIGNIQRDNRAATGLARRERLRSTVLMPLLFEDQVLGAVGLFCRRANRYSQADFDLVAAACRQIALSARQAESYALEKRQASSLAALYRLSHELSRFLTPREIVEHAFPIIKEEFSCKRLWLGVLNEQGTHLVGQGGFGPGVRGRLINIQLELNLRHDFVDEAIRTRQPVVVKAGQEMECSGLNNLIERLNPDTFIVVPLVSLGQVVGVLLVEPSVPSAFFAQRKLPLLASMASEIASVLLARRFESQMADADKMRMAALLASGVAHNFNNLLQAVMGQASLIEMQSPDESPLRDTARTIIDAAGKGAALIKQLLSFTQQGSADRRAINARDLMHESRGFYESILGTSVAFEVELEEDLPRIMADQGQLQQVVTNLLINAKEALATSADARVKISARTRILRSGEVDPELAPGKYLRIDIEDNGVGMDSEMQARCFEPFYTTKNVDAGTGLGFQGSGLGLSSAYSVVRQHDGVITVRSQVNEGTVFSIYIPCLSDVAARDSERAPSGAPFGRRAIVMDHEGMYAVPVPPVLESFGFGAEVLQDNERAVEALRKNREHYSLFLIDVDAPGFNSLSFLRHLRTEYSQLKIIAVCADKNRWVSTLSALSDIYLIEKPLGAEAITSLLSKMGYVRPKNGLISDLEVERSDQEPNKNLASKSWKNSGRGARG